MSKSSPKFLIVISLVFVVLFTYTAVSKLMEFKIYEGRMLNQPMPMLINSILVWAIPIAELLVTFLLLFSRTMKKGLYGSLFLMVLFTGYTGLMNFGFFEKVPCSCGGIIESLSWSQHFYVNTGFLLLSVAGIFLCDINYQNILRGRAAYASRQRTGKAENP